VGEVPSLSKQRVRLMKLMDKVEEFESSLFYTVFLFGVSS
jgi:hypothetical protein